MTDPSHDLHAELSSRQIARDQAMATDPPVSEAQRRAMQAAAHGHSTLGIPKKVGEEFVGKANDASFPLEVRFGGKVYHSTGKRGKNIASGEESAEYESDTGERVWRTASGAVARDAADGRWGGRKG